jgi:hypothetical protein
MNNRGIEPEPDQLEVIHSPAHQEEPEEAEELREQAHEPDDDRPLHEFIDQQTLREIFPGLCQRTR